MAELSPAAQKDESYDFLSKWFEYDTRSPSCIKWKNRFGSELLCLPAHALPLPEVGE